MRTFEIEINLQTTNDMTASELELELDDILDEWFSGCSYDFHVSLLEGGF